MTAKKKSKNPIPPLKLLTDLAIGESGQDRQDGLGFEGYARVISSAAIGTPGPFTIGVFGEWGMGKTSLMKLVAANLDESDDVITVWFNAWQYDQDEIPIIPLVGTILQKIEKNKSFRAKLSDGGEALLKALRSVAYGFSGKAEFSIPGVAKLQASVSPKEMIDRSEALTPDPLLERSLYGNAFEALDSVELPANMRVVVLIDDLDRCFPDRAVKLLETIKLVLSQRGFVFILGVARNVIEGHLAHRYENQLGISGSHGKSYLDKMIQLAFPIPPHRGQMKGLAQSILESVDENSKAALSATVPLLAEHLGENPRSLIRFVNNLLIDTEVTRASGEKTNLEIFAVTRCLQLRWREFFELVWDNQALCEKISTWDSGTILEQSQAPKDSASGRVATLLQENPELTEFLNVASVAKWLDEYSLRKRTVRIVEQREYYLKPRRVLRVQHFTMNVANSKALEARVRYQLLEDVSLKWRTIESPFAGKQSVTVALGKYTNKEEHLLLVDDNVRTEFALIDDVQEARREQSWNVRYLSDGRLSNLGRLVAIEFPNDALRKECTERERRKRLV